MSIYAPFDPLDQRRHRVHSAQDEFLDHPTFRVAGLSQPVLGMGTLDRCLWAADATFRWGDERALHSERVDEIRLRYAEGSPTEREVVVSTAVTGTGFSPPRLESELSSERDQLFDQGINVADPPDAFVSSWGDLIIDGQPFRAEILAHGRLWAARADLPIEDDDDGTAHIVTVLGYGLGPEEIQVTWVNNIRAFAEERRRVDLVADVRARQTADAVKAALPAGLDVHRELILMSLRQQRQIEELKALGRSSTGSSSQDEAYEHALWGAAVDLQSRLKGQDISVASDAVRAMVDHMRELDRTAAWFAEDGALADAAIAETVAYTSRSEVVESQKAQEAWASYRSEDLDKKPSLRAAVIDSYVREGEGGRPPILSLDLLHRVRLQRRDAVAPRDQWLEEWRLWVARQRSA